MLFTRHAKRRMRQRSVGTARVRRAAHGKKTHQGKGVYRSETEAAGITTVVVYKKRGARRILLSTWKERRTAS